MYISNLRHTRSPVPWVAYNTAKRVILGWLALSPDLVENSLVDGVRWRTRKQARVRDSVALQEKSGNRPQTHSSARGSQSPDDSQRKVMTGRKIREV